LRVLIRSETRVEDRVVPVVALAEVAAGRVHALVRASAVADLALVDVLARGAVDHGVALVAVALEAAHEVLAVVVTANVRALVHVGAVVAVRLEEESLVAAAQVRSRDICAPVLATVRLVLALVHVHAEGPHTAAVGAGRVELVPRAASTHVAAGHVVALLQAAPVVHPTLVVVEARLPILTEVVPGKTAALVLVIGQGRARLRAQIQRARAGIVGTVRAVPRQQQGRGQPSCQHPPAIVLPQVFCPHFQMPAATRLTLCLPQKVHM